MNKTRSCCNAIVVLAAIFIGGCDDEPCPPLPCTTGLTVRVATAAGAVQETYRGTVEVDGTTVQFECPVATNSPLVVCEFDRLFFPDNPPHVVLHLETTDGTLSADVAVDPLYRDIHASDDCTTGCLSAEINVVLE